MNGKERSSNSHRWPIILGIVGLLVALAVGSWFLIGPKFWTDERTVHVPNHDAQLRQVLWNVPQSLGPQFESDLQEYEPSLSPDGSEFYFVRGKPGHGAHIYASYRKNNQWMPPVPLKAVNSDFDDLGPRLTPDGQFLLFYSDRPGGMGGYDIWAAPRTAEGWGTPFNLGPQINSEFNEFSPDPTPDGNHLIFATNRKSANLQQKQAWKATVRETVSADYDLWIAQAIHLPTPATPATAPAETQPTTLPSAQPGLAFQPAREIPGLNTPFVEGASCMSPAGDFLYFSSNRPGGFGNFDISRSRVSIKEGGDWVFGPSENAGPQINTADNETDPSLAFNGYRLYFSSDRGSSSGIYRLLISDSREVYLTHESRHMPHAGLSFWIMLLSLLALIPLLMFLRGWDDNRLSTLQRCLLLSLLVHVGICFALSFLKVTTQAYHYVRQEMGIELPIALSAPKDVEIGYAIRQQSSSDVQVPGAPPADLPQTQTPIEMVQTPGRVDVAAPQAHVTPADVEVAINVAHPAMPPKADVPVAAQATAPTIDLAGFRVAGGAPVSQTENRPQVRETTLQAARASSESPPARAAIDIAPNAAAPVQTPTGANLSTPGAQIAKALMGNAASGAAKVEADASSTLASPSVSAPSAASNLARVAGKEQGNLTSSSTPQETSARQQTQEPATPVGALAASSTLVPTSAPPAVDSIAPLPVHHSAAPSSTSGAAADGPVAAAQVPSEPKLGGPIASSVNKAQTAEPTPSLAAAGSIQNPTTRAASAIAEAEQPAAPDGLRNLAAPSAPADVRTGTGSIATAAPLASHLPMPQNVSSSDAIASIGPSAGAPAMPAVTLPKSLSSGVPARAAGGADKQVTTDFPAFAAARTVHGVEGAPHASDVAIDIGLNAAPSALAKPGGNGGGIDPVEAHPHIGTLASADAMPQAAIKLDPIGLAAASVRVPDSPFKMRDPEVHKPVIERLGGSKESEGAVDRALVWLASVQEEDGRWSYVTSNQRRRREQLHPHDMACTGLAALAFLAQDHRPDKAGPYQNVVKNAIDYLLTQQLPSGDLRGPMSGGGADMGNMYDQGIATLAIAEAAIMTQDRRYIDAALLGAKFIIAAQNEQTGGWRYIPNEQGDSSVFGWQIMALHSAEQLGFEIPLETRMGALRYIEMASSGDHQMLAGYQPRQSPTPPMTAEIAFARMLLGQQLTQEEMQEVADFLGAQPPDRGNADIYYWYYGSLCMMQMQTDSWKTWNTRTRDTLVRMQRKVGADAGYWDNMRWSDRGGRVFSTAMAALTLEVYYRYMPLQKHSEEKPEMDAARRSSPQPDERR